MAGHPDDASLIRVHDLSYLTRVHDLSCLIRVHDFSSLIRVHDLDGRLRGTGFLADHHGTLITSHEAVDGLPRLLLYDAGDRCCAVGADAVTPLPGLDLALVRTEGLTAEPLPVTVRDPVGTGTYVRLPAGGWREARVLAETPVTYTAADGASHLLDGALELAIGTAGRDALRPGGGAAGGPVLDATTGAVVAVLGTALRRGPREAGFAVPLRAAATTSAPLAELLARNAATVPAHGADLNLAGVLELTAASADFGERGVPPVERAAPAREFTAFTAGPATVLGLVGEPGSGRTTELAALAGRRARGAEPAPTLSLRGADLRSEDDSIADAVRRALARAVPAARLPGDPSAEVTPERLARLAHAAGRPLLLLLDGPEEMPPALAHRLTDWTAGTVTWLAETGTRLVIACRPEYWERAGAHFPPELLHGESDSGGPLPRCVRLGALTPDEAREARTRYALPDRVLASPDARHPLALRLLAELRGALPDRPPAPPVGRDDLFSAHLDLMCLRIAVRLAAANGLPGSAVRRLAAKVSGQVHEAARRSLGPGQGELDRAAFEAVFPRGPAPARLGGTGWASAVLAEGLLVPAGAGYRFAHEEFADWIQGSHLDLDEALRILIHRRGGHRPPVPHHRIGPVVQALLLLARRHGTDRLADRLEALTRALDSTAPAAAWWAARLLTGTLLRVPDATPYIPVLRLLAEKVPEARRTEFGTGFGAGIRAGFGAGFWCGLALSAESRLDLLRRLVPADGAPGRGPRHLDTVARLLAADAVVVQPCLTRWFEDERVLPATPHATVASAAQALLYTHRHRAPDDLLDVLADCAHPRAAELLAVLAREEPSAVCRAVERWAGQPARLDAAVTCGLRAAPHATADADRLSLRRAALALLPREGLYGGALALLVRDPGTRDRYLPPALERFAAGDPRLPTDALLTALATHPEPVLDAVRARLRRPDAAGAGRALRALTEVTTPALATRVAALLREAARRRPEVAGETAGYVERRLDQGRTARAVLFPLVTGLLDGDGPEVVRAALAGVLAAPGTPESRPLRRELLDFLLAREREPAVLDAVLYATARCGGEERRRLVHRTGTLLARTPGGPARFDRGLVDLGRQVPGFAAQLAGWLTDAPGEWATLVGPGARRAIENLAGTRVSA